MPTSGDHKAPHFALLPSAGMGHLGPFSRLAATLATSGCHVSFVTSTGSTVSLTESKHVSQLLSSFPKINPLLLPLVELHSSTIDPFLLRFEALRQSAAGLPSVLASVGRSPPVSALIVDISLASTFVPIANQMKLPCYIMFISCTAMLSLCAVYATCGGGGDVDIPGLWTIRKSSIPPPLLIPDHLFRKQFVENGVILPKADGILMNTFEAFEPQGLAALKAGLVAPGLPPTFAIGPLRPLRHETGSPLPWLDQQPVGSVVFVCFGNRSAMTKEQIKELGVGLERSQCRFLWVLKTTVVDRDEEERELDELFGEGYMERVKGRGLVMNAWVEQVEVLGHRAVGGFLSHCGWNSVVESAMEGLRMLGWPSGGDHRVNAEVMAKSGLGVWMEEWSWEAQDRVVSGEEIAKKVREFMEDEELKCRAARLGEEARRAIGVGGSSTKDLEDFISKCRCSK